MCAKRNGQWKLVIGGKVTPVCFEGSVGYIGVFAGLMGFLGVVGVVTTKQE